MMRRSEKLRQIPPDWDLWQKLYYKHPQAYLRQRLFAIKYLWEGKSRPEVTQLVGCNYKSLTKWIDNFLEGGLQKLTQPITHQVPSRLQQQFVETLKKNSNPSKQEREKIVFFDEFAVYDRPSLF